MRKYSEKEISIFNGVLKLLKQGKQWNELRASEIAEATGIGKGTLYDYFASKDEILINTLLFSINHELEKCEEISKEKSFMEQTDCILKQIGKKAGHFLAVKELMFEKRASKKEMKKEMLKYTEDFEASKLRLKRVLDDYIHKGITENIITINNESMIMNTIFILLRGFISLQKCGIMDKTEEDYLMERIETVKMILYKSLHE